MANQYLQHVAHLSGAPRHASRVAGIFGDAPKPTALAPRPSKSWRDYLDELKAKAPPDVEDNYGKGAVGAAVGLYAFRKTHPVLGTIGGFSAGRNLPALFGPDRRLALCNLGVVAAGIAASLYVPKHPAWAFLGGGLAAGTAIYLAKWRR